jgi:hypothetical protein
MQALIAAPFSDCEAVGEEWPHLAALRVSPLAETSDEATADWFAACHRLTPRVERTGRWSALLDLGICTDAEAVAALRGLVEWLVAAGLQVRAGIAPSAALAQLAQLTCTPHHPHVVLAPAEVPAFLKRMPVAALLHLHPRGLLTPEVVARLQRYGLRTLGHIARLDELALRRQFGVAGSFLAGLAQGRDARPLCPTPPPAELRIRARFAAPVAPEELLAALPHLAERAADRLRLQGRQARSLRLAVRWESGAVQRSRLTLRQYIDSMTVLASELRRMASVVMPCQPAVKAAPEGLAAAQSACADSDANSETIGHDRVEELWLTLADFAPAVPAQATFWRTRAQQVAAIEQVAETLARRHRRPLLFRTRLATPAAIFSEERYRFTPPDAALLDAIEFVGMADVDVADLRASRMRPRRLPQADVSDMSRVGDFSDVDAGDAWRDVPQRVHWW